MKLETYLYEWDENEFAFRIYEPDFTGRANLFMTQATMAREFLTQYQDNRRYVAADPDSFVRLAHAILMKVFVNYKEE